MIFDDLLKKNQLVAFAKKAQQPAPILAKIAQEHGFDKTAKLFQSGRIEDMVENLGSDLVDQFSQKINQQTQKITEQFLGNVAHWLNSLTDSDTPPVGQVLLTLGSFPFTVSQVAHQSIKRTHNYRWAQQDRLMRSPAHQFIGLGIESVRLDGYILPSYIKKPDPLANLRDMAKTGLPFELIDHFGTLYGQYVILNIEENSSELNTIGAAQYIDFQIELVAYGMDAQEFNSDGNSFDSPGFESA